MVSSSSDLMGSKPMLDILKRLEEKMDRRFDKVDERFDKIDERFGKVDDRFGTIEAELEKRGVLLESINSDLKQTMEGVIGNRQVLDDKFAEVLRKLDERVQPIELAIRNTRPSGG
jgi:DNA anti-recombination protein RmuC